MMYNSFKKAVMCYTVPVKIFIKKIKNEEKKNTHQHFIPYITYVTLTEG